MTRPLEFTPNTMARGEDDDARHKNHNPDANRNPDAC
jgi:hypothetical protein